MIERTLRRKLALICFCLAVFLVSPALAVTPKIAKVEPPNWWIGMPPNPMLLISGEGLEGARVSTTYPGVRVTRVQAQAGGRYCFVWLTIAPDTVAARVPITITTDSGTAQIFFLIAAREQSPQSSDHSQLGPGDGLTRDDVIYLIMPDRFADGNTANDRPQGAPAGTYDRANPRAYHGGDLRGIREHLPYLKDLGITAIWLTPIWANDVSVSDYHGYHPVDFYAVDPHMGTLREYRDLVEAAHALGIKVVIDYVANHAGPTNPWAQQPPTSTWLHGTQQKHLEPKYDFWPLVDPHATLRDRRNVLEGWFADRLPDLNPDDPLLATYLLQNAEWWMESSRADAFRLDTFPYSSRSFWSGWHQAIFSAYPRTFTVGEAWNFDPAVTSFFQGGRRQYDGIDTGVTSVFDFPLFHTLREVILQGASAKKLAEVFEHDALYPNPKVLVTFIGNHDTKRFMSEDGATASKLKAAFTFIITARGIPQIYAGDEIAMPGGDDPDNRRDFPGGFPGDKRDAFVESQRTADEQDVFAHVRQLLALRSEHPALREGTQWQLAAEDAYYAFARVEDNDRLLVVLNSSQSAQAVRISLADTPFEQIKEVQSLLGAPTAGIARAEFTTTLPANSAAVYELK